MDKSQPPWLEDGEHLAEPPPAELKSVSKYAFIFQTSLKVFSIILCTLMMITAFLGLGKFFNFS
jgi:hypothetical protein